jgi:hypothetical protein
MNPERTRLQHEQREEQTADLQHTTRTQAAHEFESVEQMIREDAAEVQVPATVEERLSQSVQQNPRPPGSWWKRWRKS